VCIGNFHVWTLWTSNGKPLIPVNEGKVVEYIPFPPINLLWHDLEETVRSNKVKPIPPSKDWVYEEKEIEVTFVKNIKYILAHHHDWRIIVHVRRLPIQH